MFCALELVFGSTEGVGSYFHILRARSRFRRVPFSWFVLPDSFSAVPRASGPFFMFCTPRLDFDGSEGIGSLFHVLRPRTHFRWYRGRRVPFSCFCSRTHFQRYRGHRVPFSCFALPNSFSALSWASGPLFLFSAPGLIFGGSEGVGSRFPVWSPHTRFRRYRGRPVPFSSFARPDTFWAVSRASCPVSMFCAP
jgi:hypothetical protein